MRWQRDLGGKHFPPRIGSDGTVFYALYDTTYSYVYAFTPDGSTKWQSAKEPGWTIKAVGPDGVYLRNQWTGLLSLNPSTGQEKWRNDIDSLYWTALTIGADGTLYVRGNYNIQALSPATGKEIWRVYGNYDPMGSEIAINTDGSLAFVSGRSSYYLSILKPQ